MKISVALCTYNGEKFLRKQIDSILDQTAKVDEIVICDDGSKDNTQSILSEYQQKFSEIFRIHINEKNLRSVKNFEKAISLCTGDVIFLSDQDDLWIENKVETYLNYFETHPNIEVLCSNGFIIDEQDNKLERYTVWDAPEFIKRNNKCIDYFKIFCTIGNFATGASMAIKKSFVQNVIPFPVVEGFHHDEYLAVSSAEQKKFDFLKEKLFCYRVHSDQLVGGISYTKDDASKQKIITKFDTEKEPESFRDFKSKIRTLQDKEKKFNRYLETQTNESIKRFLTFIRSEKETLYKKMQSRNPLFSLFFKYLYR